MSNKRRMIHERFFESLSVADWTLRQRYLVLGMITHADDQGRLPADSRWLRSKIFPYDDVTMADIEQDLQAISAKNDTVLFYEVDGRPYIQLNNWWEYQGLQWAAPSEFPAPDGWQDRIRQLQYKPERWVFTHNWPGSEDKLAYIEAEIPANGLDNGSSNGLGDKSAGALPNTLPDVSGISISITNTNPILEGVGGVGEGEEAEYQTAVRASLELLDYWQDLTGSFAPKNDEEKRKNDYIGPLNRLWIRCDRDLTRAKELLKENRQQMLGEGKTPFRPGAIVPSIIAKLDGVAATSGQKPIAPGLPVIVSNGRNW